METIPDLELVIGYQNNPEFHEYVDKASLKYKGRHDAVEYVLSLAISKEQLAYYEKEVCDR